MNSTIYLLPYKNQSAGIEIKLSSQLRAFESAQLKSVSIAHNNRFLRYTLTILNEFLLPFIFLGKSKIYYRYCPNFPITNFSLSLLSFFKSVYVEYNAAVEPELRLLSSKLLPLHKLSMFFLRHSNVHHLPVTGEIREIESLPARSKILGNGYNLPTASPAEIDTSIIEKIKEVRGQGQKVLLFVGSDNYSWHGLDRITELFSAMTDSCHVIIVGSEEPKEVTPSNFTYLGARKNDEVRALCHHADFGIGTFALDRKGLSEACPLKVREYLCHGLPVIVNYHDVLMDEEWAQPYFYRVDWENLNEIKHFLGKEFDRSLIEYLARNELSWQNVFKKTGVIPS